LGFSFIAVLESFYSLTLLTVLCLNVLNESIKSEVLFRGGKLIMNAKRILSLIKQCSIMFFIVTMVIACETGIRVTLENKTQDNIKWSKDGAHIPVGGDVIVGTVEDEEDEDAFHVEIFRSYGCIAEILISGVNFPKEEDEETLFYETVVLTEDPRDTIHAKPTKGYVTTEVRECRN